MARALAATVAPGRLTVVVNVGDDDYMYGVHVAADLDTVCYTLGGIEGPNGWGVAADTFTVMDTLAERSIDTSFRLGDRDLATCLRRTQLLRSGQPLSTVTAELATSLGIEATVLPATDDDLKTVVQIEDGSWLSFQDYFVVRRHRDRVIDLVYRGSEACRPAPGVLEAVAAADIVVIAPSNPPLSIWPMLAVPGIRPAIAAADNVVAVSPLFGGKALKGPAEQVMGSIGLAPGTAGILEAYEGLIGTLVVDKDDSADVRFASARTSIVVADTRIADPEAGRRFGAWLMDTMAP
jgi:LPPG:FO 2-phospho-L-lactate transferase